MAARKAVGYGVFVLLFRVAAGQYGSCDGNTGDIGDGFCDDINNNAECGYDGGDCCVCTCTDDRTYPCSAFYCLDPDAPDGFFDCEEPPAAARPCPADAELDWVVQDTASATSLAEAINCSGAIFNVEWSGNVVVSRAIYVSGGTTLNIVGRDSEAAIDGGGATRLFLVVNASLHVSNLQLTGASAAMGGAIAANGSNLSFEDTSFTDNFSKGDGGALFLVGGTTATWSGTAIFSGNECRGAGGVVYIERGSGTLLTENASFVGNTAMYGGVATVMDVAEVAWEGATTFADNFAIRRGGCLFVGRHSNVSWEGDTSFHGNVASLDGGAMFIRYESLVSWSGNTTFHDNIAFENGGALFLQERSKVSWDGNTTFHGNVASENGGALFLQEGSKVSWDGRTSFHDNVALGNGGVLFLNNGSRVSWSGSTSFFDNIVDGSGGSVCVLGGSSVSWSGETSFHHNVVSSDGGALAVYSDSSVSWTAATSFYGNRAGTLVPLYGFGGAIFLLGRCSVSWEAPTKFSGNWAAVSGGAVDSSYLCSIGWGANTVFAGNTAEVGDGGALTVMLESTASWGGETLFSGNAAREGGAFFSSFYSLVEWTGKTVFDGNSATLFHGGAISSVMYSNVFWGAETSFLGNVAGASAGAIYAFVNVGLSWTARTSFIGNVANTSHAGAIGIQASCNISWHEKTLFYNNTAVVYGGAMFVTDFFAEDAPSRMLVNGSTMFLENHCGAGGGGIAASDNVLLYFGEGLVTFSKNSADLTAGAMYLSGIGYGPHFRGVKFISNSARVGGAVQAIAVGDAIDEYNTKFPVLFSSCEFDGNKAVVSGGAMEISAAMEVIVGTSFLGNSAGVGGALRVAGQTTVVDCAFVDNRSARERGPAISNIGFINLMRDNSFVDHAYICEPGTFVDYEEAPADLDTVCDECNKACTNCTYEGHIPTCREVMEHASSGGIDVTIETIEIDAGYWRATRTSREVLACFNPDACRGGITGEPGFCRDGYEGPYCSVCSDGYTKSLGFVCDRCKSRTDGIAFAASVCFVVTCALILIVEYLVSDHSEHGSLGVVQRMTRHIPLQSLKIVIVVWQIITEFSMAANVTYPDLYQNFLDGVSFINFDLGWLFSTGCLVHMDFHDRLLLSTMGPIVVMALLGVTYAVAAWRYRASAAARKEVHRKHLSVLLLLTFLIYSPVSSTLFQMFACESLDDGSTYLIADYRIECDSDGHRLLQIYAGFMIFLFPIGIPLYYALLLYANRDVLKDKNRREGNGRVGWFSDLWVPYHSERYYYELVEYCRRILLAGIVVFIYPNTAGQIAVTLIIAAFFSIVFEVLVPYVSPWDTWIARAGHAIVFTTVYLALLLRLDVSNETSDSQRVFNVILVFTHVCIILAVIAETVGMAFALRAERSELDSPQVRRAGAAAMDVLVVYGIPPPSIPNAYRTRTP